MPDETLPPPLPQQPGSVSTKARTEPFAIWSLILSILSWFGCFFLTAIPGIIFGHVARSKIRRSNGALQGMNMAIVGLIVGYAAIPFGVLGSIMVADMLRSERVRLHDLAVEKKEIASDDNKLKITTSGFWVKRTDINSQAALQAGYKANELYVIVIGDAKSAIGNINLQQHHQLTREHMMQKMTDASTTEPVSRTIDGHPALQDEITGTVQGSNLVFLHTTVDEGDSFQQILAWTLKSRWPKHNSELREVTESFRLEK